MHNLYLIQSLIAQSFLDQLYDLLLQVSTFILGVIDAYGYAGIFIGMVIESIGIPLPSEIILPYAGYLAYLGRFDFWIVVIVGTLACLVGSLITYFIAFFGGNYFFERYGKYVGLTDRELHLADEWFEKYAEIFVFFSRMIPGVRAYSSIPAGLCRICLLYTSDAADEEDSVDLGGRRIIKKKNKRQAELRLTRRPFQQKAPLTCKQNM